MLEGRGQVESLEERQWRQLMEQARARIAEEEAEWKLLMERARAATDNEEREWERLRSRAERNTSGFFTTSAAATPAATTSVKSAGGRNLLTDYVAAVAAPRARPVIVHAWP